MRLCVGCGERESKSRLLRFTLGAEGALVLGSGNGRGGYLHPRRKCVRAFATSRAGFVRSVGVVLSREMRERGALLIEQSATLWP